MTNLREEIRACARDVSAPEPGHVSAEFCFPAGFTGFRGHFAGDPILPGVCLMEAAVVLLEAGGHPRLTLRRVRSAKFFAPVRPEASIRLSCKEATRDNGTLRVKTAVTSGADKVASLDLEFSCDEP